MLFAALGHVHRLAVEEFDFQPRLIQKCGVSGYLFSTIKVLCRHASHSVMRVQSVCVCVCVCVCALSLKIFKVSGIQTDILNFFNLFLVSESTFPGKRRTHAAFPGVPGGRAPQSASEGKRDRDLGKKECLSVMLLGTQKEHEKQCKSTLCKTFFKFQQAELLHSVQCMSCFACAFYVLSGAEQVPERT